MIDADPDEPMGGRLVGLFEGEVVDRDDPDGLRRVRVRIPGVVEPASAWAWPMATAGGGSAGRGATFVPEVGAEVMVLFNQGDPDRPHYVCGHWGQRDGEASEVPEPARASPDVSVIETRRWRIVFDDRPESASLLIMDKAGASLIEIDGVTHGVQIKGTSAIVIEAVGLVDIKGLTVAINGRPVLPGGGPI